MRAMGGGGSEERRNMQRNVIRGTQIGTYGGRWLPKSFRGDGPATEVDYKGDLKEDLSCPTK